MESSPSVTHPHFQAPFSPSPLSSPCHERVGNPPLYVPEHHWDESAPPTTPGQGTVVGAYLLPALPHLALGQGPWLSLRSAAQLAGKQVAALQPDVLVIQSSQWQTPGVTFIQGADVLQGSHTDPSWHQLGAFHYNVSIDQPLSKAIYENLEHHDYSVSEVCTKQYPLDVGTLVTLHYLNSHKPVPVVIISSDPTLDRDSMVAMGQHVRKVIETSGKRACLITANGMSQRFYPSLDHRNRDAISRPADDEWNRKILTWMSQGDTEALLKWGPQYAIEAQVDNGFKGVFWLLGAMPPRPWMADVMAYGPIWGTGASLVKFI